MKRLLKASIGLLVLLMLVACGNSSVAKTTSNKKLKLFTEAMQSKTATVWFPLNFEDDYHNSNEVELSTATKIPEIIVVKDGKATQYSAVTYANTDEDYWGRSYHNYDNAPTLGQLSKMSTNQIIKKYQTLDKEAFNYYKNNLIKQIIKINDQKMASQVVPTNASSTAQASIKAIQAGNAKYSPKYVNWLNNTAKAYTKPRAQTIRAYIAPDSTGNSTKQEGLLLSKATIWGNNDRFMTDESLSKQLGIPETVTVNDTPQKAITFDLPTQNSLRSWGASFQFIPSSEQISQVIYKNTYYGFWGGQKNALITPKETFKRLGTSNTKFKLDDPGDKNIGKLTLK